MATDNNDFTHEFQIYSTDKNAGTMGTGKFLLFDNNINAVKVESIDNIKIGGGSNGRVLATDGEGNLRWISAAAVTGGVSSYNDLEDLPTLFSGDYNDLTNKPNVILNADVNSLDGGDTFITQTSDTVSLGQVAAQSIVVGPSGIQIAGTGGVTIMGAVGSNVTLGGQTSGDIVFASGTSGIDYNDLNNKPSIPSVDTGNFTFTNNTITTDNGQDDIVLSIQGYDATQPTPNLVDFSWTFDTRGGLTLPSNLFFAHAYFTAEDDEQIFAGNTNKDFRLRTMNNSVPGINDWIFDIDGTLTVPGTITKGDNLTLNSGGESGYTAAVVADGDAGRVFLRTDDGTTLHTWQFDKDGNLTLPNGGDIKDSSGNSVLGGSSSDRLVNGNKSLILASDGNVDVNGHITIKKESDYLSTIGKTTTFGTTILNTKLFVNYNEVGITSTIDVETMPDETTTATVKVGGAVATMLSTDDDAGDPVTQYRGQLDVSYTGITLTLATPTTETNWVFDNNNLKLPAGGDIVDINGNSVLGSGGVSLPANASGYLTNDGEGNLAWAAGDGTFSGDYNDLVNKPSIPAAQINSDWNETISESPAYIFNKPTIPTSLSDFGITAGLDGQVLTLNSSLTPVWATPSGGSASTGDITFDGVQIIGAETVRGGGSIELVPNNGTDYVTAGQYINIYPTNAQDAPHIHVDAGAGGDLILGNDNFNVDVNHNGDVRITAYDSADSTSYQWRFNNDGKFQLPTNGIIQQNGSFTRTTTPGINGATTNGVVWTSLYNDISSVKLTIQLETNEVDDTTGWHTQVCEAIIASRGAGTGGGGIGDPVMTVYGVTYTSTVPLATFTVQRDPITQLIEVVATRTAATVEGINFRIHSVEMKTRD